MQEILLPKMGNSVEEAEIVKWFKQEGDTVQTGEPLFSIQTDKAEVECESTASGVLRKILMPEGVEVPVLTVIALVGAADEPLPDLSQYGAGGSATAAQSEATVVSVASAPQSAPVTLISASKAPVSPRARKAAAARGINASALAGSGAGGRILEADVLAAVPAASVKITPTAKRMLENAGASADGITGTGIGGKITKSDVGQALEKPAASPAKEGTVAEGGAPRRVPLTPMRRIIATRMSASK